MVRKCLLLLLIAGMFLAFPAVAYAGWTRIYGGDADDGGYCVRQTSDGGYIVSGYSYSLNSLWILKIDEYGDTLWTRDSTDWRIGKGYSVQETADGGWIVTGYVAPFRDGKHHLYLIKLDSEGQVLWTRGDWEWINEPVGGVGYSVQETSDGGYIIAGATSPWFGEIEDLWLIKTNSEGDTLWTRIYGGEGPDCGCSVREASDGGYIVAGYTSTDWSLWLLRTDENGDIVWTSGLDEWWYGKGYSVTETSDGGWIVTGYVEPFDDAKHHLIVARMDSDGDTLWTRMEQGWFPNGAGGVGRCIQETSDGNFILTGYTSEWIGDTNDLFLVKLNPAGDTLWSRIYGGEDEDIGYCVGQTADGGYIITGATKSFSVDGYDLWLLKTDASGDTLGVIKELVVDVGSNWYVFSPIGSEIVLRYEDSPCGFHAFVFDAAGRKVDELHSTEQSGIVTWGEEYSPGVYFIRVESDTSGSARKVVLMK
ncbi:MAG: T9SS type A sorting domain-containing protein [Candidatus Stahlbacteria bacterium]|nr:MAG: T9SS type A sorting domain-containing protein [Candidatus Stahlbacteria bacterium]